MKYSEFVTKINALGLKVDLIVFENYVSVRCDNSEVAVVSKNYINVIDTDYTTWKGLEIWKQKILFDNLAVLAKTPLEKREDEKKYNVVACRHMWGAKGKITEITRFYYRSTSNHLGVSGEGCNREADHQWSMEQIKDWGLEDCERIEVEEEDK